MLLEPASVVAKAWEHIERIGGRGRVGTRGVLVTGAGPIGLLAALMGRSAAGRSTSSTGHRRAEAGAGARLGATYHA